MEFDLIGCPLAKRFPARQAAPLDLFDGSSWIQAARDWAHPRPVTDWQVWRSAFVVEGAWYTVEWVDDAWHVTPF
jgi:hypothetical protein